MKKIICMFFVVMLVSTMAISGYSLDVGDNNPEIYVEYLSDGSYFIVEVNQAPTMGRSSGTSGNKRATYYIDNDIPIYSVDVHGTFTYDGISATADSASVTVYRYTSDASLDSKGAYTSGASAVGYAYVDYCSRTVYKSVTLTCSKDGKLS